MVSEDRGMKCNYVKLKGDDLAIMVIIILQKF